jgi:hypothetical protein
MKALLAIVVSFIGALSVALGAGNNAGIGDIDTVTWLGIVAATLGSGGLVWWTQNGPWHTYIKTLMAFLTAGVASLTAAFADNHVTQGELLIAFVAAITATGLVFQAPGPPSGRSIT